MLDTRSLNGLGSLCYQRVTQQQIRLGPAELAIYGDKESLKRTNIAEDPGNADVGRNVHYLTNFS